MGLWGFQRPSASFHCRQVSGVEGAAGGPDPSYALRAGLPPSVAVWQAPLMDFYSTHKAKFCHIPSLGRKGKDSTSSLQL